MLILLFWAKKIITKKIILNLNSFINTLFVGNRFKDIVLFYIQLILIINWQNYSLYCPI